MYQQGYSDGPNGQERAWYAAPPRSEAAPPRRRSRSRAQADDSQPVQASSVAPAAVQPVGGHGANVRPQQSAVAAGQQGGYGFASNGMSHPADQPGNYAASYSSYTAPNGFVNPSTGGFGMPGYPAGGFEQNTQQSGYGQGGFGGQYYQQNAMQGGYPGYPGYGEPAGYAGFEAQPVQAEPAGYANPPASRKERAQARSSYPKQETVNPQSKSSRQEAAKPPHKHGRPEAANTQSGYPEQGYYGSGYRPAQPEPPRKSGKPAGKGGQGGAPSINVRNLFISSVALMVIASIVVLLVSVIGSGKQPDLDNPGSLSAGSQQTGAVSIGKNEAAAYATRFLPNVYVDGICLADMTFQEGSDAVWAQAREKQSGWYVRLKNENGSFKDITAGMLGISFDPTQALQQAWAVGHTPDANGQVSNKALTEAVNVALNTEYHFTSAQQSADTSPIDAILDTLQTNAYRAPQDAVILSFNPDDFVNPFTFQQEVWGQWLDISAVKQEILNMVSTLESGEVLLQITPIAPNVTVADLQKQVTLRCRAVTPISSNSTEDRTNNIRVAFSKINGKSIAHGDKFSFNKFVGRRTLENGFFQAIEYAYGEEVMGVGGGVCQASTTVYLAAIQSGMTITNREAHSNPVNYTSLGMDATVSDTRGREVDFTFRNESGGRIFIAAHVVESGSNRRSLLCEVRIYGPALEDVHYKLESETIEVIPKPEEPKLKEDKTGEHVFFVDEKKQASKGREGYVVETYLCIYQGDTLISREKISKDTYPARQDVYWVGTNAR